MRHNPHSPNDRNPQAASIRRLRLLLAAFLQLGMVSPIFPGQIYIKNGTSNTGIGISSLYAKNLEGATEGYDAAYDGSFLSSPYTNALEIFTNVDGQRLSIDARPIDTSGWSDIILSIKGSVNNINNYLRYNVFDTTDLTGKTLTLSGYGGINEQLLMDGAYHNISLPALTHGAGEYGRVNLTVTPEPSTLGLMALGGLGLLARRRRGRFSGNWGHHTWGNRGHHTMALR